MHRRGRAVARGDVHLDAEKKRKWPVVLLRENCVDRADEEMAAESTRRFTKNLLKPGTAAEIRQTASNAVRHSAVTQEKPKQIDPLDYEAVVSELDAELKEDPLRDLLLFPDNDFTVITVPVERRTLLSTVPDGAELAECLLVRQACKYYNSPQHLVQYKYEEYAADYRLLPRKLSKTEKLPSHSFEIDHEDVDKDEVRAPPLSGALSQSQLCAALAAETCFTADL